MSPSHFGLRGGQLGWVHHDFFSFSEKGCWGYWLFRLVLSCLFPFLSDLGRQGRMGWGGSFGNHFPLVRAGGMRRHRI